MKRLVLITLGVLAGLASAALAASSPSATPRVSLKVHRSSARPGSRVRVTVINNTSTPIVYAPCFRLARRVGRRWTTITRTHGQPIVCPNVAFNQKPRSRVDQTLYLFDDLQPGRYRVTLRYTVGATGRQRSLTARAYLTVTGSVTVTRSRERTNPRSSADRRKRAAPGPAAAASEPPLRLVRTETIVDAVHPDPTQPAAAEIPVFVVASLRQRFEVRVARAALGRPVIARQVVRDAHGTHLRMLPRSVVPSFASTGLDGFFRLTVRDVRGGLRLQRQSSFCPMNRQPVTPAAPEALVYPDSGCGITTGNNPFTLGQVWGIENGWGAAAMSSNERGLDLPDGVYRAELAVTSRYQRLFGIPNTPARFTLRVRTDSPSPPTSPESPGPSGSPVPPGMQRLGAHARRTKNPERPPAAPKRPGRAPTRASDQATLPNLAALPAWGIQTAVDDRGHDQLQFSATVWNAGPAPLTVDGFRTGGSGLMDAYQNFYRGGKRVGYRKVGKFEYDPRPGHEHWHFRDFASYTLLNRQGGKVVVSGKESFCLAATDAEDLTVNAALWRPQTIGFSGCGTRSSLALSEAMPVGWGDTYVQSLPGQSFDITGVPNGTYLIEIHANPHGRLLETTARDNVSLRRVTLAGGRGKRTVTAAPYRGIKG